MESFVSVAGLTRRFLRSGHVSSGARVRTLPRRARGVLTIAFLGAASSLAAQTTYEFGIREHVFDNGLRLLVVERPDDPRVAAKIFTDFGSLIEQPGQLGAAHFLEHLLFKGTRSLGTTDWQREQPLRDSIARMDRALSEARNAARNELRERGVFHDYRHAQSTPLIDSIQAEIARLELTASAYRDPGAMMRWYQAYGGTGLTATTEQEYMKFDINLPRERVELFLRVESDRMRNTVFREFDAERMILVEQRLGDLNRVSTPFYEAMNAQVGMVHPVFFPEGYRSDFYQYNRAYQRNLYERWFIPNNTTLVFVGGVRLEDMVPLVDRWFGDMYRAPEPTRTFAIEPVPHGEKRLIWSSPDLSPRVDMRHLIPGVGHPDRPHVDVLAEVLRLEVGDALRDAGVNGSVDVNTRVVHTERFGVPATLNIEVVTGSEATLDAAEQAVLIAITRVQQRGTAAGRLARVKKRLRTEWYRTQQNADAFAFEIGHFQTMDSWQTLAEHLNARERTTSDDLMRIASRYLIADNRTVGAVRREVER